MERRSPTDGEVVGVHRCRLFPARNLGGPNRWVVVIEREDGSWEKRLLPAGRARPGIRDKR